MLPRAGLLERLLAARNMHIVTIVAPAGYGKTTLMVQWNERETRPVAWLSVDHVDNDPANLLSHITAALFKSGMLTGAPTADARLPSDLVISHGVPALTHALESAGSAGVLMLDHVESIHSRASNDAIAELVARLPRSVQLVVASRTTVRLPTTVLRNEGSLLEVTTPDLAMDEDEARSLLHHLGVEADDLADLVDRTEGWPTGLYLVGLAMKAGSGGRADPQIGGNDRLLVDYLRNEILTHLSDARASFLTRTSILERFCGPLCDAVLGTTDSARMIERLEGSNLLIVPLDRTRDWYRYHHLLREFLQAELRRREPDAVPGLHVSAAKWFDANGMPELAISHAQAAGDEDLVASIVGRVARSTYGIGRADTVIGWLRWFEHTNRISNYPAIAALGGMVHALSGDEAGAERWASVLLAGDGGDDGAPQPSAAFLLRAILFRSGTAQLRADARAAQRGETMDPEWLSAALGLEGFSYLWEGDADRADGLFAQAGAAGEWFLALPAANMALAARALIAIGRGDWKEADQLVARSLELMREHDLGHYLTSGLTFAVATHCALRRGDVPDGRRLLARGAIVRPLLTTATPGLSVQTLLELAKAHTELSDFAGARVVMREAAAILAKRYDLGVLSRQYDEVRAHLNTLATSAVGATSLTAAELRLLPLLATHLSFPEIGERLYVSRHTVKTQAMSIYRKFGASSRSEAVQRAVVAGFLTG